jgi:toxin FitB
VYLVDTDVISELRKKRKTNKGVSAFFRQAVAQNASWYLSAVTIGELRRGVEMIRHRGDLTQANLLDTWLTSIVSDYADNVLALEHEVAQVWGRLRVPHAENALDKQIAATALIHDLTLVTRNVKHFEGTGVRLFNPFN